MRLRKQKKAQIQMGETIVIIFIFIILVSFGLIAYVKIQKGSFAEAQDEQAGLTATEVALKVLYLPEVRCSFEDVPIHNCIDIGKLVAFTLNDPTPAQLHPFTIPSPTDATYASLYVGTAISQFSLDYFDMFGYSNITLTSIIPNPNPADPGTKYTLYATPPPNPNYADSLSTYIPVSTYDPKADDGFRFGYGILEVKVFKRSAEDLS